jgi:peroxiredoxin
MSRNIPSKNRSLARGIALVVVIASAGGLSFGFAKALRDSVKWRRMSERAVVNPTFEARDPAGGERIFEFSLEDRQGRPIRLSQFRGADVLVVNIWSTGCPACERELPSLAEMDRRLASLGRVALLTISIDTAFDDVAHLFPNGTDLRILFDPDQKVTRGAFGTTLYPETFILDRERRVRARFDGERAWHTREMLDYIASFLPD